MPVCPARRPSVTGLARLRVHQVSFGGDPEAALVTFSNPAEAKAAYKCTEAVLNNRFIKVFWHNKERDEATGEVRAGSVGLKDLFVSHSSLSGIHPCGIA